MALALGTSDLPAWVPCVCSDVAGLSELTTFFASTLLLGQGQGHFRATGKDEVHCVPWIDLKTTDHNLCECMTL